MWTPTTHPSPEKVLQCYIIVKGWEIGGFKCYTKCYMSRLMCDILERASLGKTPLGSVRFFEVIPWNRAGRSVQMAREAARASDPF